MEDITDFLDKAVKEDVLHRPIDFFLDLLYGSKPGQKTQFGNEPSVGPRSQEELFKIYDSVIKMGNGIMWMYGLDRPYMERKKTRKTIEHNKNVTICTFISEEDDISDLPIKEGELVARIPGEILQGYTIFGKSGIVALWDSTTPTVYVPELDHGVIWRACYKNEVWMNVLNEILGLSILLNSYQKVSAEATHYQIPINL